MNLSIHPRVVNGKTVHEKKNTRKSVNRDRLPRLIERMEEHLDRHPFDSATKEHLQKVRSI